MEYIRNVCTYEMYVHTRCMYKKLKGGVGGSGAGAFKKRTLVNHYIVIRKLVYYYMNVFPLSLYNEMSLRIFQFVIVRLKLLNANYKILQIAVLLQFIKKKCRDAIF